MDYNLRDLLCVRKSMDAFLHWRMHNNYNIEVGKFINCNLGVVFMVSKSSIQKPIIGLNKIKESF